MSGSGRQSAALDLTHVLYDDTSLLSLALALITLSPILLMASYAALAVQTRELTIIVMWAGQLAGEVFNWVLKHAIKQDRPIESIGNGYGFPSSHSQYMGYFSSFLICHLYFRHRFASTGSAIADHLFRGAVYLALLLWTGAVAYSRYELHLGYHNTNQIIWGLSIGALLGTSMYALAEYIPRHHPQSTLGALKLFVLDNPVSSWLQIRDGWAVWADGGREGEWIRWKAEWEKQKRVRDRRSR
ncbi:hypothetical protein BDZ94DRAFT_1158613 [Collybia nuda]|uniref:Phosphatidic acid phosphatase type 2/haloperoxidase domain-containing protein n=1 Tax=Collybia nuda TaxID=64659 RepID=A0A9P6CMX2_9AGAR|nr:hypothetical protein BDZ94DRAFT_1158613 [Collybia nuda]